MSKLAKSTPAASNARSQGHTSPSSASPAIPTLFKDEPSSPNPRPLRPLSSSLPSLHDSSRLASTAQTQLVRRGSSSTSPPSLADDVHSRFLLYNAAGRLIGAREPIDPWGVLVSEHITLNCTYNHRTVRVGRGDGCDAVLKDASVSSTHFTISLELEPYEQQGGANSSSNDSGPAGGSTTGGNVEESVKDLSWWGVSPQSSSAVGASRATENEECTGTQAAVASPTSVPPLSPQDAGLPRWRMRRVLLTDCSTNGTYINDERVGRGHYRELHSGNDIGIVRVPETACEARTSSPSPSVVVRGAINDAVGDVNGNDEMREGKTGMPCGPQGGSEDSRGRRRSSTHQRGRTGRELKRKPATPLPSSTLTSSIAAETVGSTADRRRRRRAREGVDDNDGNDNTTDDRLSFCDRDLDETQMLTALLSTLTASKHTYLERFCFHLYNSEEPPSHGAEGGVTSDALDGLRQRATSPPQHQLGETKNHTSPSYSNSEEEHEGEGTRGSQKEQQLCVPAQREGASLKPMSPTSSHHPCNPDTSSAAVAAVPHQRSVHFSNPSEADEEHAEETDKNVATRIPTTTTNPSSRPVPSGSPTGVLSRVSVSPKHDGALSDSASTGPPRTPIARQEQAVLTLVTPLSLLRSRPSICTSFIAPITLSEREESTMSSVGSAPHQMNPTATSTATAATGFHESLHISPAVRRRAAAQQRADTRRARETRLLANNSSSGNPGDDSSGSSSRHLTSSANVGALKDVPVDIPIRYAVLPLRHLQWGGRIGCGASGEVYMGIDVSTATAVAIKVLKGGSLFRPATMERAPPAVSAAAGASSQGDGSRCGGVPLAVPNRVLQPDGDTLLSLSDVSLGNSPPAPRSPSPSASDTSVSVCVSTEAPATAVAGTAVCATGKETSWAANEEAIPQRSEGGGASVQASAATAPLTPASSSSSAHTPTDCARRPSSALVTSAAVTPMASSGTGALTLTHSQVQQQQPPPPPGQPHVEAPHSPRPSAPPIIRKHFREILFLTTLQHPRIVRFLGFQFTMDGRLCLLMEYVAGGTLQTLIRNFGAFEENVIRLYTLQILEGLEYLARKGAVHGDLKSANILVSEQGNVKLTDFGTSRFVRECATDELEAAAERHCRASTASRPNTPSQQSRERCPRAPPPSHSGAESEEAEQERRSCTRSRSSDDRTDEEGGDVYSEECSDTYTDVSGEQEEEQGDTSQQRVLCGTPLYMSPELIRTQEPSFASDIWALGCVVFEMATGGILPWRPVHNSNASAVIWYIGQRRSASEGPPLDDVYAARERLNDTMMHRHTGSGNGGERAFFDAGEGEGHADGNPTNCWGTTPSPMLIDLLQCALNINAADRPSAAELLQHPFIRNESSLTALEKWHAAVAAKHRTMAAKCASRQIEAAGFGDEEHRRGEESVDHATPEIGHGHDHAEEEKEEERSRAKSHRRSRPSASHNTTRSNSGSPFQTAVVACDANTNNTGGGGGGGSSVLPGRRAITPPHTTPPPPLCVEEIVDADESDDNVDHHNVFLASRPTTTTTTITVIDDTPCSSSAQAPRTKEEASRRNRPPSQTPSLPPPPKRVDTALPQQPSPILVKGTSTTPHDYSRNTAAASSLLGATTTREDVTLLPISALASAQPPQQSSPVAAAQPHPPPANRKGSRGRLSSKKGAPSAPSVLGEGNPDSQPLIDEPPRPAGATGFWGRHARREDAPLPTGTGDSMQIPSPLTLSSTALPSAQLPHPSYSGNSSLPAPSMMSQLHPCTAPAPFKIPQPRSQAHSAQGVSQQQQQQCFAGPASQPCGTYGHSNIAQHQSFLRQMEQARLSSSLAMAQPPHQSFRRRRTEGELPTYRSATLFQLPLQGSVLGNSQGYSYQNPQLNTQTMEMHIPNCFASQSSRSGSRRYTAQQQQQQHGGKSQISKRKGRVGGGGTSVAAGGGGSAYPSEAAPASRSPRGPASQPGPVLSSTGNGTSFSSVQPQHQPLSFLPPPLPPVWRPGELTMDMENNTLSSPRANNLPNSAPTSAYTGVVPPMSQPPPQQRLQGSGSPTYSGGGTMTSGNPASPPDYALSRNTAPVLGKGSRPRRSLWRRGRGGCRSSELGWRQSVVIAARVDHRANCSGDSGSAGGGVAVPRRSSIGSFRQRRRSHSAQGNQRSEFVRKRATGRRSAVAFPASADHKSAAHPTPAPAPPLPSSQAPPLAESPPAQTPRREEEQHQAGLKRISAEKSAVFSAGQQQGRKAGKRQRVTRTRSTHGGKGAAKREPRRQSKEE